MTYVRKYFEKVLEHLNGRRLFSIQIENELGYITFVVPELTYWDMIYAAY